METKEIRILLVVVLVSLSIISKGQIDPKISFNDHPETHNMHICSDGNYYYTVNGGKEYNGQISKYDFSGG